MREFIKSLYNEALYFEHNNLIASLLATALLTLVLRWFYVKFGTTPSNRRSLGNNFLLLATSVTLIIFMIKSSIALSLGLVGALSIVRFRAAIKSPEELVYLFFAIAIGLGMGAGQNGATFTAFCVILPCLYLKYRFLDQPTSEENLFINVRLPKQENKNLLDQFIKELEKNTLTTEIKRIENNKSITMATFVVTVKNYNCLKTIQDNTLSFCPESEISIVDNSNPVLLN